MQTDTYQFLQLPGSRRDRRCSSASSHIGAAHFEIPTAIFFSGAQPPSTAGPDVSALGCAEANWVRGDRFGHISERELVERACYGDDHSLEVLCQRHWICVHRLVTKMMPGPTDAEEITGEVFARAIASMSSILCDGRDLCSNLKMIAMELECSGRGPGADLLGCHEEQGFAPSEVGEDVDDDWFPRGRRFEREVLAFLPALSGRHRRLLELRLVAGFTAIEVAALWGRSITDVLKVEVDALAALKAEMFSGIAETTSGGYR